MNTIRKTGRAFFMLITCVLQVCIIHAQIKKQNYAFISAADSKETIIEKAANITPSQRQLRWQQLELTAFFHFGINTYTDREWGDGKESPSLFNPTALNAEQWISTVKKAGIKQVILTAKHHDGFCLWPSKYTEHSVKNSPWKKGKGDVVKEVSDACRKNKIGFGIYLSPWDRNSALYGTAAYNDYFVNQLTELLTRYGRIDEVWFDGANGEGPNGKKQEYDFTRWYALIRKLQPNAVIAVMGPDVRWVGTETGYGRDTEWSVVPASNLSQEEITANSQKEIGIAPRVDWSGQDLGSREKIYKAQSLVWYPAETDVSIRPGWFYHASEDSKVKTPEKLLDIYLNAVGKNSVLLLNIPPDKRGLLSDADINSLQKWKLLRDTIFNNNLMANAIIYNKDKRYTYPLQPTHVKPLRIDVTQGAATIEIQLASEKTFNMLELQENIAIGQRVEQFKLYYWDNKTWQIATEGTTVGYKRILKFNKIAASKIRLVIASARLNPEIATMGLYLQE